MKPIFAMLLGLLLCIGGNAQKVLGYENRTTHKAFQSGESLTYTLRYGIVVGGKAYITVQDEKLNNESVQHVVVKGVTTGMVNAVYKVRDSYESYIVPETELPAKAIRNIREGRYRKYEEVVYERDSNRVNSTRNGIVEVPENTLDIVSAFFHARNNTFNDDLQPGDTIRYTTYFASEIWTLTIRYMGKETIKSDFGKVECYKFCPLTEVGRAFKSEDDMHVWITADRNRIPIKIKFDLFVGSFTCELVEYSGLKYPFGS